MFRLTASVIAVAAALLATSPERAEACGACFSPPETITTVDAHRMAVALGTERSILWDQIRYSGDPEDFVWVMPVPNPDVEIDVADERFFDRLEAQTAVQILAPPLPPPPTCPGPPNGAVVGADAGAGVSADAGVDIYSEEVVGPYETVVIGSEDAGALVDWLNANGYNVAEATLPTIQHYTALGSEFVVLRLAPDQGVAAMQPIRIEYPGHMGVFPLKMVTIGASGTLAMTLWIFAEQRYQAVNYETIEIDADQLQWDFAQSQSNYRQLFRRSIDDSGGRSWVTQFANISSDWWFDVGGEYARVEEILSYPYLTRLETDMLIDHLDKDLRLGPSDGTVVTNVMQAQKGLNIPPPPQCPDWNGNGIPDDREKSSSIGCRAGGGAGLGAALVILIGAAVGARRRRGSR